MENLHERSIDRSRAQIVLADVKEDADRQHLAEFEAITEGEIAPAITREIDEDRRHMTQPLGQLEELGAGEAQVARLRQTLSTVESAMDEKLRLIRTALAGEGRG